MLLLYIIIIITVIIITIIISIIIISIIIINIIIIYIFIQQKTNNVILGLSENVLLQFNKKIDDIPSNFIKFRGTYLQTSSERGISFFWNQKLKSCCAIAFFRQVFCANINGDWEPGTDLESTFFLFPKSGMATLCLPTWNERCSTHHLTSAKPFSKSRL